MFISLHNKTTAANLSRLGYRVIKPNESGAGQMYQSYCIQWMRWIVLNNPELNNYGPVYFLHCASCQEHQTAGGYSIQPVVRVGSQAISINVNEYVFLPVIMAAADPIDTPGIPDDPMALLNYVRMDLQGGDNPPLSEQVKIARVTGGPRNNLVEDADLSHYLVISDVFRLDVPSAQLGASLLRTCFDLPINTEGVRDCVVGGWWILIQFTTPGTYYIHSYAKGRGQYRAAMFYQIDVLGDSTRTISTTPRKPPKDWSKSAVLTLAKNKKETEEISEDQYKAIKSIFDVDTT
jgi:hypothetical protein